MEVRPLRAGEEEGRPHRLIHRSDAYTAAHHIGCEGDGCEQLLCELDVGCHGVVIAD